MAGYCRSRASGTCDEQQAMDAMDAALEDFPAFRRADVRWHIGLAEATGSDRLVAAATEAQGGMSDLIGHIAHPPELLAWTNRQHREMVAAVRHGECVVVYPEGTLTRDPAQWPMTGKTGAARIALETGCPVIPVGQWGPQQLLPPYSMRPHLLPRKHVTMRAGDPVDLSDLVALPRTPEVVQQATDGAATTTKHPVTHKRPTTSKHTATRQAGAGEKLIKPVDGPITAHVGEMSSIRGGRHTGTDFGVPSGTDVHAAASGKVVSAGDGGAFGNEIIIQHGPKRFTEYAHLSSFRLGRGSRVNTGTVIGRIGSSGFSTGPHLHFEVRVRGAAVDPLPALR